MMLFIVGYVVPMALSLLAALLCWKSERFRNWWIDGKKNELPVIFLVSFIPLLNLAHIVLISGCIFLCTWKHTFGKIKFNYPPHLK